MTVVRVRVLLFAAFRELFGQQRLDVSLPGGSTVEELLSDLMERQPKLRDYLPYTTVAVDREVVARDFPLTDGAEVALLQPASGGAPVSIALLTEPLSAQRCLDAVRGAGSGGISLFIGTVRDMSEGKQVSYLEYEAYVPMAREKLRQVVDEMMEHWPVQAVAIEHRLGRLEIGDDAVVAAVACPHRAEAFDACRYAIDRLKEIVPIWKKEHGEDGAIWVGGPTAATSTPAAERD